MNVDVATYKAEFMSHYYEGRLRSRSAYAFGLVDRWARLASRAPRLVNFLSSTQPFSGIAKAVAGMPEARRIPRFAPRTFRSRFADRPRGRAGRERVLLWPDTFNNHFEGGPDTAMAAVEALEMAGLEVAIPAKRLCCGRPLYEFGMLDRARRYLREAMDAIADDIQAGTPVVVLEPACASVFRDELPNLFFGSEQAKRLARQTRLLSEILHERDVALPKLERRAIVHGHCHHKSVLKMDAEVAVLKSLGLDFEVLDSGCCGMAGSFGFTREKYDVSMACAERVLLPAVRSADPQALVIANGFSCREQVEQATGKRPLHLAEVLAMALRDRSSSARAPSGTPPATAA